VPGEASAPVMLSPAIEALPNIPNDDLRLVGKAAYAVELGDVAIVCRTICLVLRVRSPKSSLCSPVCIKAKERA
jgi:hypothetical protein